jgi:hypothetical protein
MSSLVFSGICVTRSLVLYVCFVDRCLFFCPFSFGHCVVWPLRFTHSDYLFGILRLFLYHINHLLNIWMIKADARGIRMIVTKRCMRVVITVWCWSMAQRFSKHVIGRGVFLVWILMTSFLICTNKTCNDSDSKS